MEKIILLILLNIFILLFLAVFKEETTIKTSHLRMTQVAGQELFTQKMCNNCHTLDDEAEGELMPVINRRENDWFIAHVQEESDIVLVEAKSKRKQRRIFKRELAALLDFLFEPGARAEVMFLPDNIRQGAYLGYQNNCIGCHKIAGAGKEIGPDLTYIADEKGDKDWLLDNLKNPQKYSAESPMPALKGKLTEDDLDKIADYIMTLKK